LNSTKHAQCASDSQTPSSSARCSELTGSMSLGGANIIQEYLKAGLLDEMQIHVIPVLFGDGTRLFEDLGGRRIELKRTSTIDTPGATHLRFSVQR